MRGLDVAVQLPLTVDKHAHDFLQQQIAGQIRALIRDGRLPLGAKLTSIRELALQLDLSLNTVKLAYQELISEGYLETSEARGTFVAHVLPDGAAPTTPPVAPRVSAGERHPALYPPPFPVGPRVNRRPAPDPSVIDFWPGRTDPRAFPTREWGHLITSRLQEADSRLTDYGDAAGFDALRAAIAEHLGRARGFKPEVEQIVVTSGIQEALAILSRMLVAPGDTAIVEGPCYSGASRTLAGFGGRLHRVPVDDLGLRAADLPEARAACIYVTPSHQFPLGHTMALSRREALLSWAGRTGAYIVEDDYDSDFRFESSPLPALAALDGRGSVIYLGTFSKAMGAGLRLGYMVLPHELVEHACVIKSVLCVCQEWLNQAAMADYIAGGDYARRLRRMRLDRRERRDVLFRELQRHFGSIILRGLSGGMHVVWHLPQGVARASTLQRSALAAGVRVYTPAAAGADMSGFESLDDALLVFGYASLAADEISRGIAALANCVG